MATGRGAGHHGVHDFIRVETRDRNLFFRVNDSRDNHCETVWEYASRHGKSSTVLNYYGTAPPKKIKGHSIPGFTSARHLRRSSHPANLFDRLRELEGLDIGVLALDTQVEKQGLQDLEPDKWIAWIQQHIDREKAWFAVLEHLMINEPSDLTVIVFDGVDKIQHLAYRYLDPAFCPSNPDAWESDVIELCREYFRNIDGFLARTTERLGAWGRVFVASDHGFTGSTELFYVNKWLHEQGYLKWREEVPEDDRESIFVDHLRRLASAIDLEETKAFALTPSSNGIYIRVPEPEYHAFRDELIRKLEALRGPDGGQIVTEIKKREDWFPGPQMDRIPDLTLSLRDFGFFSVLNAREVLVPRKQPVGTHHPHGILIAKGPGIKQGARIDTLDIPNVTPLLAHSLGLEIPRDWEYEFPGVVYEDEYLASDPPRLAEASPAEAAAGEGGAAAQEPDFDEEDEEIIMERLKALGYIE